MARPLLLAALAALCAALGVAAAPLSTVQSVAALWEQTALTAAEATMAAIQQKVGKDSRLALRGVPLDSVRVFAGRRHQLAVELDGVEYKLTFNTDVNGGSFEPDITKRPSGAPGLRTPALPGSAEAPLATAAGGGSGGGGPVVAAPAAAGAGAPDPFQWQRQHIWLPEITLAGPLEVVFPAATQLALFLPHRVEAPPARRLLLAPGAALTLRNIRGVSLRRPVDLPTLPPSYLAEVLAHAKLGEAEPGFRAAPGILYLASELYRAATNASLSADAGKGGAGGRQLLSFLVEPSAAGDGAVTAVSPPLPPAHEPQRLRARRLGDGSMEIGPREPAAAEAAHGEEAAAAAAAAAAAGGGGAAASPPFSWPLPLVGQSAWLPYESLLRGVIASHPFNLKGALRRGAELRLTQSSLHGVRLLSFDMELAVGDPPKGKGAPRIGEVALQLMKGIDAERVSEGSRDNLELWQAVVEVKERPDGTGVDYVPVSVKRKWDFHSTLSLTPSGLADALGRGNGTSVYKMTLTPVAAGEE